MRLLIIAILYCCPPPNAYAHKVISVTDGDTLTVLQSGQPLQIRLANIDAPEKGQPFREKSRQSLVAMCAGKDASYTPENIDKYGRTVAVVKCAGVEVNRQQVARGLAWVYTQYNKDNTLPPLESKIKSQKAGLWANRAPVPPWDYRHGKTTDEKEIEASPRPKAMATCYTGPRGGRYHVANGKKVYRGC